MLSQMKLSKVQRHKLDAIVKEYEGFDTSDLVEMVGELGVPKGYRGTDDEYYNELQEMNRGELIEELIGYMTPREIDKFDLPGYQVPKSSRVARSKSKRKYSRSSGIASVRRVT